MTTKQLTEETKTFSLNVVPEFSFAMQGNEGEQKKQRTFSGLAYSGEKIDGHWYWGDLVFDLSTMSVPNKLPALLDHDAGKRCGYVTAFNIDQTAGFNVAGNLLSNKYGSEVTNDSDEGFPWQMSVRIDPGSVEEVNSGNTVIVNGRSFNGPITIFRNSTISEVSFTALGWDSNTTATALSKQNQLSKEQDMAMTDAEKKELDDLKAANTALQAENAGFKDQFSKLQADKRMGEVEAFYKETKQEFSADSDEVKAFAAMPEALFKSTTDTLKAQFAKTPATVNPNLFSHQAQTGGEVPGSTTASKESPLLADAKKRSGK